MGTQHLPLDAQCNPLPHPAPPVAPPLPLPPPFSPLPPSPQHPPRPPLQDAHEFLNYLLNVSSELLEAAAKERGQDPKGRTWVTDIFQVGGGGAHRGGAHVPGAVWEWCVEDGAGDSSGGWAGAALWGVD